MRPSTAKDTDKFVINKDKLPVTLHDNTQLYCMFGQHTSLDADGFPLTDKEVESLAKQITKNNAKKFYVKVGTNGNLANPFNYMEKASHEKSAHNTGILQFKFVEVNQNTFDIYLTFLKTKNEVRLTQAERARL